jgi:hypothetical protein
MERQEDIVILLENQYVGHKAYNYEYGGHKTYNYKYGGHPAPTGPALPNLINAVRMFKIKTAFVLTLVLTLTF